LTFKKGKTRAATTRVFLKEGGVKLSFTSAWEYITPKILKEDDRKIKLKLNVQISSQKKRTQSTDNRAGLRRTLIGVRPLA
jgi:hypothetical protein